MTELRDMQDQITELKTQQEIEASYILMKELRTSLTLENYIQSTQDMFTKGYRLFALTNAKKMLALSGVSIETNLYYGKHLWVYDLVTTASERSKGHGQKLLQFLEELARENNCQCLALSSGLQRERAHQFYQKQMQYEKVSYVFKKDFVEIP